ncbi:MAG: hypothetical protein V1921_06770, partial [Candidatus Altiarchaeota archaeon]
TQYSLVGNYQKGGPARTILEFPVTGQAESAELCVYYYNKIYSGNAYDVIADYYRGDGLVNRSDFDSGTLLGTLYTAYSPYGEYCVNVTEGYNNATSFLGLRLHWNTTNEQEGGATGHQNYWYTYQAETNKKPYLKIHNQNTTTVPTTTTTMP